MEETIEKLKSLVRENYESYKCGWTYQRSEGNFCDCFEDGSEYGASWLAYEIGCILGMDLKEPEQPDDEE